MMPKGKSFPEQHSNTAVCCQCQKTFTYLTRFYVNFQRKYCSNNCKHAVAKQRRAEPMPMTADKARRRIAVLLRREGKARDERVKLEVELACLIWGVQ